jgi:riboflavin synthase
VFTGLIEDLGTVVELRTTQKEVRITIRSQRICSDLVVGDSVSVNGACLTSVHIAGDHFTALATAETLRRTSLGLLAKGSMVNLERALRLGGRLGGHLVLGHVDGMGQVRHIYPEGEALRLEVNVPENLQQMLVPKGSIAVDGVSLTVADLLPAGFWVSLIPHTLGATTLQHRRAGDSVNLETDIIGKYVSRLMGLDTHSEGAPSPVDQGRGPLQKALSLDLLKEHGFA